MKNKLFLPLIFGLGILSSCGEQPNYPFEKKYTPGPFTIEYKTHDVDQGFKLDGVLNESEYSSVKHLRLRKEMSLDWANLDIVMYYGEEGVYLGIDVTENTKLYCNPNRATYLNSGIEMYMLKNGSSGYGQPYCLEIDLVADGTLEVKRNISGSTYGNCETTYDITPVLASRIKEEKNQEYGYVHELFMSYDYFRYLGFCEEDEVVQTLTCDFVHIASRNYDGKDSDVDRNYYSFAEHDLDAGVAWVLPSKLYRFNNEVGYVCHDLYIEVYGNGKVTTNYHYDYVPMGNSCTLFIEPEGGHLRNIQSILINDYDYIDDLKTTMVDGRYQIRLTSNDVVDDLTIEVYFN